MENFQHFLLGRPEDALQCKGVRLSEPCQRICMKHAWKLVGDKAKQRSTMRSTRPPQWPKQASSHLALLKGEQEPLSSH